MSDITWTPPEKLIDSFKTKLDNDGNTVLDMVAWNDLKENDQVLIHHTKYGHVLKAEVLVVERLRNCIMLQLKVDNVFYHHDGGQVYHWQRQYKLHDRRSDVVRWKRVPEIKGIYFYVKPLSPEEKLRQKLAANAAKRQAYAQHRNVITERRDVLGDALQVLGCSPNITDEEFRIIVRNNMKKFHPDKARYAADMGMTSEQWMSQATVVQNAIATLQHTLFSKKYDS